MGLVAGHGGGTGEDLTVFGDGSQTRSFCYVTDTIRGLLLLSGRENLNGDVLNVGSPEETRIIDLAEELFNYLPLGRKSSSYLFQPGTIEGACPR